MGFTDSGFTGASAGPFSAASFSELEGADDVALCDLVRADAESPLGRAAFSALYDKHREAVTAQAYTMTRDWSRAEDLVSETFTRVLRALSGGNGPRESVLGYLLIALRSEACRVAEIAAESVAVAPETIADFFDAAPDFVEGLSERDQIRRAFASLPADTRQLLWLVDVEGLTAEQAATHFDTTAGALRVALHRARKRLGTSYLQQYVEVSDLECLPFAQQLASLTRQALGKRDAAEVEAHLRTCAACASQAARLRSLSEQLRVWVGPLVIGGVAGTAASAGIVGTSDAWAHSGPGNPASEGARAQAVPAATVKKVAAWGSLVVGVVLVIWGASLVGTRPPVTHPTDPVTQGPAQPDDGTEAVPPVDSAEQDPAGQGSPSPEPQQPLSGGAVLEGDDDTPHWFLQE
ncbi:RNA polymerase sigma factor [Leucobacter komagatae]|uniref:RNA polymerase sigma factor (Sigma-70 family) n=1 Tax=Leucobacter komagatae TaxID=55969 RepID=A0A0D0IQ93_9MICO|nr:sigma-70 family RNA polymerase sigma factor [Leucobacter komagatae]KIP51653.1 hypothetical protein SD72_13910 [Leucobacter komagatae]